MNAEAAALLELLRQNPHVSMVRIRLNANPPELEYRCNTPCALPLRALPPALKRFPVHQIVAAPIRTMLLPDPADYPANEHQICYDEPVPSGVQIQPRGANWVGTAGAPVRWPNPAGDPVYGILSNWHVMAAGDETPGRPQHQPDSRQLAYARLNRSSAPNPNLTNYIDAALADAHMDGLHTIDDTILGIGPVDPQTVDAEPGLRVLKAGRTTEVTAGICESVGAAVRVSYGDFTALFADQDVYADAGETFAAPGDSGSLIVHRTTHAPVSLLFAGGGGLTIGNPVRYLEQAFSLHWQLR